MGKNKQSNPKGDNNKGSATKSVRKANDDVNAKTTNNLNGRPERSGELRLGPDGLPLPPRVNLFPGWTGKTPLTLLNEFCQKQKWNKPSLQPRRYDKGFVSVVHLSKTTNSGDVLRARFEPPGDRYSPSAAIANHWAATYALHRVNSRISMHHAMPPPHRDYWLDLEKIRKERGEQDEWKYSPDPFNVTPPRFGSPRMGDGARSGGGGGAGGGGGNGGGARVSSNGEERRGIITDARLASDAKHFEDKAEREAAHREKNRWDALPMVHMSPESRSAVEQVVREFFGTPEAGDASLEEADEDGNAVAPKRKINTQLRDALIRMGFRSSHVEEALQFCENQTSALDWLCLYVPEDDLPSNFLQNIYNPKLSATRHDTASLALEYATQRLSAIGFPRELSKSILESNEGKEERALQILLERLSNVSLEPDSGESPQDREELEMLWNEEICASQAIYDKRFSQPSARTVAIQLQLPRNTPVSGSVQLEIRVPEDCAYPYGVPLIVIRNSHLPAYIRLTIMRELILEAQNLIGSGMIYSLVEWAEENVERLVSNPPSLRSVTVGLQRHQNSPTPPLNEDSSKSESSGITKREAWMEPASKTTNLDGASSKGNNPEPLKRNKTMDAKLLQKMKMTRTEPKFANMLQKRAQLPSFAFKEHIVQAVRENQVVIISGETGCGKTTQVPQFILDALIESSSGSLASIVCTQPRRLSATAVADRVASERCEKAGETVGYAIRGESKQSRDTRLVFCTTGVLLRRLMTDPILVDASHVIVDEVHERTVDGDFLLVILRAALARRPDLRVILMSATLDATSFSKYFSNAPCIDIPGRTFPVDSLYLENILQKTRYVPRGGGGPKKRNDDDSEELRKELEADGGFDESTIRSLEKAAGANQGRLDYELIAGLVDWIDKNAEDDGKGAVLVFLPGTMEIKRCIDQIRMISASKGRFEVWPLHAGLTSQEQSNVFRIPPLGVRKIVVSTNVAETSITIDGVVHVIDSGRVKELRYEPQTRMVKLEETWASRASCKQRLGRAGRTQPGICYKLYTRRLESKTMSPRTTPEILRTPLEQLCLQIKTMGYGDAKKFLLQAIDPPTLEAMDSAIGMLMALGALDPDTKELTAMGRHMAAIPADIRIAKMLIYGSVFRCLRPVLTIAACLSSKPPFISPMDKRDEAKEAKERFSAGKSDLLTASMAYDAWEELRKTASTSEMRRFCETNFLSTQTLFEIRDLRKQYAGLLGELGFVPSFRSSSKHKLSSLDTDAAFNANSSNLRIVKATVCAGLYPNVARIQHPKTTYEQGMHGSVAIDAEAKMIKYFTKEDGRVFLHPSTIGFSINKYEESFLVYFSKMETSKVFLFDATPVGAYPLLMFGGKLTVDHHGRGIWVDGKVALRAWARIAGTSPSRQSRDIFIVFPFLVHHLTRFLSISQLFLYEKYDVSSTAVIDVMTRLITSDGE